MPHGPGLKLITVLGKAGVEAGGSLLLISTGSDKIQATRFVDGPLLTVTMTKSRHLGEPDGPHGPG